MRSTPRDCGCGYPNQIGQVVRGETLLGHGTWYLCTPSDYGERSFQKSLSPLWDLENTDDLIVMKRHSVTVVVVISFGGGGDVAFVGAVGVVVNYLPRNCSLTEKWQYLKESVCGGVWQAGVLACLRA